MQLRIQRQIARDEHGNARAFSVKARMVLSERDRELVRQYGIGPLADFLTLSSGSSAVANQLYQLDNDLFTRDFGTVKEAVAFVDGLSTACHETVQEWLDCDAYEGETSETFE